MSEEREILVNRLIKMYPYNREWFESRTTAQLIVMLNKKSNKRNPDSERLDISEQDSEYRKYDDETGQWIVRTDGHGWEPESN